jgi:hypothetical protein
MDATEKSASVHQDVPKINLENLRNSFLQLLGGVRVSATPSETK